MFALLRMIIYFSCDIGIPFAKPPIGDLLFKPAVFLPTPQVPTLNATTYGFVCFQSVRVFSGYLLSWC